MADTIACIASEKVFRPWEGERIHGTRMGSRPTPFGQSGDLFLIDEQSPAFWLVPRYGTTDQPADQRPPDPRATLYALKDVGVQHVVEWAPAAAITHTLSVGDIMLPTDLIDRTTRHPKTCFERSPIGALRQFPVFCPTLRRAAGQVLHEMKLLYHGAGTVAVGEGPRHETAAEVRQLAHSGVELVSHAFAPHVFLAKELALCYAAVAYVVAYAESGRRQQPFAPRDLFGGLTAQTEEDRLASTVGALNEIVRNIATALDEVACECDCAATMDEHVREYGLGEDWHEWFA